MQEAPIHQSHVFGQIKILQTIFERDHPRNISVKLFQNQNLRISSCPYSARSPYSPEPCFWTDQNFANSFWKGSPKEHFCEIISKSDRWFQRLRFLMNCLKKSMATRVNDRIKFCEHFLKRTSQGTFLPSLVRIGPVVWEKKMCKEIVDAPRTHHHPKRSPWACCAQVS